MINFLYFIINVIKKNIKIQILLHKNQKIFFFLMVSLSSPVSLSRNPPSLSFLPFLHRISSLRRRHRPAKPPPRSTDLGLLTPGLERRRTRLEAFESVVESRVPPAFSPPFWPRHRSGDLPPARPCSEAPTPGQIEAEQCYCRTSSTCAI